MKSPYIEALLIERVGYERRGLADRVKAVDAALREAGFEHKYLTDVTETATIEPQTERATQKRAQKRAN
tara:strand:+ start:3794 stop:4000 length:207 start_codon:yes stop_codon:yes gene_type:complete